MSSERILVVDDEQNIVKSCTKMLEVVGFDAIGTTNGHEAVEMSRAEGFDLVLVDLRMPEISGLDVLREIKAHDEEATVVIFTAYGTKDSAVEALRLGAAEFLEKPLETDVLVGTVQRLLDQENGSTVRGNIRTLSLSSIIQINCEERNQACLRVRQGGEEGRVYFADGAVTHAETGSRQGEEAFYEILKWDRGTFELKMGLEAPEQTIDMGWSSLLMEGMRRIDESAVEDQEQCPECGSYLNSNGQCNNPGCPQFTPDMEGWAGLNLEEEDRSIEEPMEDNEMANLQDVLKDMANDIPGFVSSDVVGMDGLSIAGHASDPDFDSEAASAQFALVMKLVQKTTGQLDAGEVQDNLVTTEGAYILTRFLGDGSYYLGVAVSKDEGSLGNMRLITRTYADKLWDAIPK
jgi:DNA-binding response OmpR family regulator/predicted regulator of Ras-like GTPase activity (Roadblock/LC7/MglB family)